MKGLTGCRHQACETFAYRKDTRFFSTCSWSLYSRGWFWIEFTSWALIILYLNDGISLWGWHKQVSLSNPSLLIPSMWLIPHGGVGGGQATELVDHWQILFACLPVFVAWCFLLPEETKFLSGLECLLCMMTAFFPFYLWRVPEQGNCLDVQSISFIEEKCFCL